MIELRTQLNRGGRNFSLNDEIQTRRGQTGQPRRPLDPHLITARSLSTDHVLGCRGYSLEPQYFLTLLILSLGGVYHKKLGHCDPLSSNLARRIQVSLRCVEISSEHELINYTNLPYTKVTMVYFHEISGLLLWDLFCMEGTLGFLYFIQ